MCKSKNRVSSLPSSFFFFYRWKEFYTPPQKFSFFFVHYKHTPQNNKPQKQKTKSTKTPEQARLSPKSSSSSDTLPNKGQTQQTFSPGTPHKQERNLVVCCRSHRLCFIPFFSTPSKKKKFTHIATQHKKKKQTQKSKRTERSPNNVHIFRFAKPQKSTPSKRRRNEEKAILCRSEEEEREGERAERAVWKRRDDVWEKFVWERKGKKNPHERKLTTFEGHYKVKD